jgi:hypothetical protein
VGRSHAKDAHAHQGAHAPADQQAPGHRGGQQRGHGCGHDQVREDEQDAGDADGAGHHDAEGDVEEKIPPAQPPAVRACSFRVEGDLEQRPVHRQVQRADQAVEQGQLDDLAARHGEDAAHQQRLDVLAALGRPVHHQHRGRRRHRVDDADHCLLRDRRAVHAAQREEPGAAHREGQRVPVGRVALDGVAGQEGHADAEGGHLG